MVLKINFIIASKINFIMLLKYYQLADDIAFRFSNRDWPEYPLTVDKFVKWVEHFNLDPKQDPAKNKFLNLFIRA